MTVREPLHLFLIEVTGAKLLFGREKAPVYTMGYPHPNAFNGRYHNGKFDFSELRYTHLTVKR